MLFSSSALLLAGLLLTLLEGSDSRVSNFTCKDGTNIPVHKFCDGAQDCDGSDELRLLSSSNESDISEFNCFHRITKRHCLLDREYFCNGTIYCTNTTFCDVGCPSHYKCRDDSCVPRSTICDGDSCNGCSEDDDWKTGTGFKCVKNGVTCRLPQQLLWDNVKDCDDGSDLCYQSNLNISYERDVRIFPETHFNRKSCFKCLDGSMIVHRLNICDGIIDCSDLSDECLCPKNQPAICQMVRLRTQLHRKLAQPTRGKRTLSSDRFAKTDVCKYGEVSCGSNCSVCVARSAVCDGIAQCPTNLDEGNSFCNGTLPCASGKQEEAGLSCRCSRPCLATSGVLCNGLGACPIPLMENDSQWPKLPGFPDDECEATCQLETAFGCIKSMFDNKGLPISNFDCNYFTILSNGTRIIESTIESNAISCDGILSCTANYADEKICSNRFTCPNGTRVNIPIENVCDGFVDCDNKWDENRTTCPERFFCSSLRGLKVSVSKNLVCDMMINCDSGEDEMNCNTDERFYCENKNPLFIRMYQLYDGIADCTDWSDECPTVSDVEREKVLASRFELIGNSVLRVLVWIMALLALTGNLVVIIGECANLRTIFGKKQIASLRTNHMLILNLAISDLLMGVYLVMFGIFGVTYSGVYCMKSLEWLTSQTCVAMGVLVVLSSETSMFTMLLLTLSRLYAVCYPFSACENPRPLAVLLLISVAWTISFTLALIPLGAAYQDNFVEKVWILDNPILGGVLTFKTAKQYAESLITYSSEFANLSDFEVQKTSNLKSWPDIEKFFSLHIRSSDPIAIRGYLSYYSASSACIPNFFVTPEAAAWKFSLSVTIVNFLAFLVVAVAYIGIIHNAGATKNTGMQKKIFRLVATDFCCWIPLCIMVFIKFSGVKVESIAYVVAAIVLLPINSALNPILYSSFIDKVWQKLRTADRRKS